jgi:protein SCO1
MRMKFCLCIVILALVGSPASAQLRLPAASETVHFALTAADGTAVTEQSYRGKWLAVYFGYTFCPDICPTTLLELGGALEALGPRAAAVQGIFITVDAQRDTPAMLGDYLRSFDPRLVGLTGTAPQISAAAKSFHIFYERQDHDDGTYSYDPSAYVYVVDPEGRFVKAMSGDAGSKQIAQALSALMQATH